MASPMESRWLVGKYLLRYLNGTRNLGIKYSSGDLHAFCDATWASDVETRRSQTGYIIFMNGRPIAWRTKVQSSVALSSTEAEYYALAHGCQEILWLKMLVSEIGFFYFDL